MVVETIRLLVQAALCDAPQQSSDVFATGFDGVCNATDARTRDWLWHLLTTRDIYAVPAANCAGYALRERTERHIDPNRDFPFEQSPKKCMLTTTGNWPFDGQHVEFYLCEIYSHLCAFVQLV